jgi:hypothetical protein
VGAVWRHFDASLVRREILPLAFRHSSGNG